MIIFSLATLGPDEQTTDEPASTSSESTPGIDGIDVTKENGVCTIKFNRPKKLNAITGEVSSSSQVLEFV